MTEEEKKQTDALLGQIETAAGEIFDRGGRNAELIAQILEAVNGVRGIVGVVRPH